MYLTPDCINRCFICISKDVFSKRYIPVAFNTAGLPANKLPFVVISPYDFNTTEFPETIEYDGRVTPFITDEREAIQTLSPILILPIGFPIVPLFSL